MEEEGYERARRVINRTTNTLSASALTALLTLSAINPSQPYSMDVTLPDAPDQEAPQNNDGK